MFTPYYCVVNNNKKKRRRKRLEKGSNGVINNNKIYIYDNSVDKAAVTEFIRTGTTKESA